MRPFWLAQALETDNAVAPKLTTDESAEVCIVGGGFTGLWTAILLKQAQPDVDVAIVEADICGAGASGRNGGCMLPWSTKFFTLQRLFGLDEAIRLVRASEQAIEDIDIFCQQHAIECGLRRDGTLLTATSSAQVGSTDAVVAALQQHGINTFEKLPRDEVTRRAASTRHLEGYYSPMAATVQPGKLVRGMRRVAIEMGIRLYEQSPMVSLEESPQPVVHTKEGSIKAGSVVLALNVWLPSLFREFSRTIAVVSSDMIITGPQPDLLQKIGYTSGISVLDSRIFVYYYHTTTDGRIMLGKGGNTFSYGARVMPVFDQPSPYKAQLQNSLGEFFPAFGNVPIAASWNGASDRSVTGLPFFGRLHGHAHIFYGLGFSGNGVGPTRMGGHILSSLALGLDNAWTRSPLVAGPRGHFPVEPFRYLGSIMVRNAIRRKEKAEDHGRHPRALDARLAHFADAAGKADHA